MILLGLQKLQDIDKFATMFLNYDLLAQRWVRYGYVYPFVETGAGLAMLMGVLNWLAAPAAFLVAGIGAVSVFKAVYIGRRELKCACVGDARVPLGFVSLTENLMMIGMALWMLEFAPLNSFDLPVAGGCKVISRTGMEQTNEPKFAFDSGSCCNRGRVGALGRQN